MHVGVLVPNVLIVCIPVLPHRLPTEATRFGTHFYTQRNRNTTFAANGATNGTAGGMAVSTMQMATLQFSAPEEEEASCAEKLSD